MIAEVRRILADYARLNVDAATLDEKADLYRAGLTSHGSVTVMLACEDAFEVEFSRELMRRSTFASIAAIADALTQLGASDPVNQP